MAIFPDFTFKILSISDRSGKRFSTYYVIIEHSAMPCWEGADWQQFYQWLCEDNVNADGMVAQAIAELDDPDHPLRAVRHNLWLYDGDDNIAGGGLIQFIVAQPEGWDDRRFIGMLRDGIVERMGLFYPATVQLDVKFEVTAKSNQQALKQYFEYQHFSDAERNRWLNEGPDESKVIDLMTPAHC